MARWWVQLRTVENMWETAWVDIGAGNTAQEVQRAIEEGKSPMFISHVVPLSACGKERTKVPLP